jgi:hypothetical protein
VSDKSLHSVPLSDKASRGKDSTVPSGSCDVERRKDGSLLVRMHSVDRQGRPLPDAVFTFRKGDPQYEYWDRLA